jgi:predicted porin
MKKNLIALAVAGVFVAPVAMADNANVTVYGTADVSVDQVKNGDTAAVSGVNSFKISSNASKLGFKGSEDLGGGLKAIFVIERGVQIDTNDMSTTFARNSFAGLAGDSWGQVVLGKNDTPYKSATRGLDVFADHIADNRTLMGRGVSGFDQRFNNTATYTSPDMNGFKVAAQYTVSSENNTVSTANTKGKAESLSGAYATGPFSVVAAYQKNTFGSTADSVAAVAGALTDEKAWKLGGSYKVDQFAVNAVYEKTSDSLGTTGSGHKAYYLAGVFNATANDAIKLAYTKAGKLGDGNTADTGAKQWAIGVDHSLSKRTAVYAMYTKLDNDAARNYALSAAAIASGATAATGNGSDPTAFSIGMKHTF